MMSITCPHCSRVGSLKTTVPPGTRVRCPGCQNRFEVQDESPDWEAASDVIELDDVPDPDLAPGTPASAPDFTGVADDFDPTGLSPSAATAHRSPPIPPKPMISTSPAPPEPWFYAWIEVIASIIWYVGYFSLILLGIMLIVLIVIAANVSGDFPAGALAVASWIFFVSLVGSLPGFLLASLLHLAVDAARSLRAMRHLLNQIRQAP